MKRLSKEQKARKEGLIKDLHEKWAELEVEIEKYNKEMKEAYMRVSVAIDSLNSAFNDANEFIEEVAGDIGTYMDERSDKWRDSDAGNAYETWKEEWANLSLDQIDASEPEDIEMPETNIEAFEALADEPS